MRCDKCGKKIITGQGYDVETPNGDVSKMTVFHFKCRYPEKVDKNSKQ